MVEFPPKISVVIPAHNEEGWIKRAVESVKRQDYPGEFEIIVVDNASTDKTAELASLSGARVVFEDKRGLPAARNAGYRAAQGEIIAYLDADSIAPLNWLKSFLKPFSDPKVIAVSGGFWIEGSNNFIHRWFFKFYYGIFEPLLIWCFRIFLGIVPFAGPNFAVRKATLDSVEGFDLSIPFWGEDLAIAIRLKKAGKIIRSPFRVYSSARRYNSKGVLKPFAIYALNYSWILIFKRSFSWDYGDSYQESRHTSLQVSKEIKL